MKAIHQLNKRGTVHDWLPTAVRNYLYAKCQRWRQRAKWDLQSEPSDLKGMPLCKRCFPEGKRDE